MTLFVSRFMIFTVIKGTVCNFSHVLRTTRRQHFLPLLLLSNHTQS